jgi:hypothetical protein
LATTKGLPAATDFQDREFYEGFAHSLLSETPVPLLNASGVNLYARGGYLLMMLDWRFGTDRTLEAMREFRTGLEQETRSDPAEVSSRFAAYLETALGPDNEGFLEAWTTSTKRFDPAILRVQTGSNTARLQLRHNGEVRFPVPIRLMLAGNQTLDMVWEGTNDCDTLKVETTSAVLAAELDTDHRLLDFDRSNNRATANARLQSQPVRLISTPGGKHTSKATASPL